jgi:hypothetical protein
MRNISVEMDTFAAIWADRRPGEDTEDAVIRRRFGVKPAPVREIPTKIGFSDLQLKHPLPEGFEIFRTYKGTEYRATAIDGQWLLANTGRKYPSLNQLSRAVSSNVENAWKNWYFKNQNGQRRLVDELRRHWMTNSEPVKRRRVP